MDILKEVYCNSVSEIRCSLNDSDSLKVSNSRIFNTIWDILLEQIAMEGKIKMEDEAVIELDSIEECEKIKKYGGWVGSVILLYPINLFFEFLAAVLQVQQRNSGGSAYIAGYLIAAGLFPLFVVLFFQIWEKFRNNHSRFKIATFATLWSILSTVVKLNSYN